MEESTITRSTVGALSKQVEISIDGSRILAEDGEMLLDAVLRQVQIPHICYHSALMGPIQTCDTCIVEVDGRLLRSCGTTVILTLLSALSLIAFIRWQFSTKNLYPPSTG